MQLAAVFILLCFSTAARADNSRLTELKNHPERVMGVELLTAGSTDVSAMSRFGHAMLRLVTEDEGAPFNDPVFSFGADMLGDQPDTWQNYRRGLFGGYPVQVTALPLSTVYLNYAIGQARPLERSIIPTDSVSRKRLINLLLDWQANGNGRYYFVSRNCVGLVEEILNKAGIHFLNPTIVPAEAHLAITMSLLSPYPLVSTFKPLETLQLIPRFLKFDFKFTWTAEERQILNSAPTLRLQQLNQLMADPRFQDMRQDLSSILVTRNDRADLATLFEINPFPRVLYELCSFSNCDKHAIRTALNNPYFSAGLQKQIGENRIAMGNVALVLGANPQAFDQYAEVNPWAYNFKQVSEIEASLTLK